MIFLSNLPLPPNFRLRVPHLFGKEINNVNGIGIIN